MARSLLAPSRVAGVRGRPIRRVFCDLCGLARLAHHEEPLADAHDLLETWIFVARDDEEQQRVGANVLVLGDGDDQSRGAGVVVALADDPDLRPVPAEEMDSLLSPLVLLPVRCFVQRQSSFASADAWSLALDPDSRSDDFRCPPQSSLATSTLEAA